jgi:hypothetical protein
VLNWLTELTDLATSSMRAKMVQVDMLFETVTELFSKDKGWDPAALRKHAGEEWTKRVEVSGSEVNMVVE